MRVSRLVGLRRRLAAKGAGSQGARAVMQRGGFNAARVARLLRELANELDPPSAAPAPRVRPEDAHDQAARALRRAGVNVGERWDDAADTDR